MKSLTLIICIFFYSEISFSQIISLDTLKSFPTAEGYGQFSCVNQPTREVYYVTTLNDSGPGSLRDALSQGNRLVLFKTSGTIVLSSQIESNGNNIYIAGQTAFYDSGQGITIKSDGMQNLGLLWFTGDHIVIRYLRLRRGAGSPSGELCGDDINFYGSSNWVIDHCSISWSTDENISASSGMNGTIQYSISSEGLYFSTHGYSVDSTNGAYQNGHSKGGLFGCTGHVPDKLTFYRNLFAHNDGRNPRIYGPGSRHEIVNNLMYNNRYFNIELSTDTCGPRIETNVVKNLLVPGLDTRTSRFMVHTTESVFNRIYMKGNIGNHRTNNTLSEWLEVGSYSNPLGETGRSFTPFDTPLSQKYDSLPNALDFQSIVLEDVGANLSIDSVDNRIINDVINLTPTVQKTLKGTDPHHWNGQSIYYGIINDPADVGGWPNIAPMNSIVQDDNNDGIDDSWATVHQVVNWYDVLDTYTFDNLIVNNIAGYSARQIFLAFLGEDFTRILNNETLVSLDQESVLLGKQPTVYPNPTSHKINIIPNGFNISQIELFDLQGKRIKFPSTNDIHTINMEKLEKGMYFLILGSSESKYYMKVIKQ